MKADAKQSLLNGYDPLLGYVYSDGSYISLQKGLEDHLNGITRIGKNANKDIRIAILGGSTSDISYEGNWMRELYVLLEERGLKPLIICAGISGYSTSQELFKLIRDVLPLKPQIVISLSGVNDMGFIQAHMPQNPYIHAYQQRIGNFLVEKFGSKKTNESFFRQKVPTQQEKFIGMNQEMSLGAMVLGVESKEKDYEIWHKNIRMQKAICYEFDLDYFACLQPIFGFGKYKASVAEKDVYSKFLEQRFIHKIPYHEALNSFYKEAKKIAQNASTYIYDLTDIFENEYETFSDPRHLNLHGNRVLAHKIMEILDNRILLKSKADLNV